MSRPRPPPLGVKFCSPRPVSRTYQTARDTATAGPVTVNPDDSAFRIARRIRGHELDASGHAFPGRVFQWCHEAFEALLVAAGDQLARAFDEEGWGMPLVRVEARLIRPMVRAERIVVALSVERVGRTSITFGYALYGATGDVCARARLVHVFVTLAGLRKLDRVPERVLAALRRAEVFG